MLRSPQLCIFCTLSLHTFNIILLTKPSSVSLLPPVLSSVRYVYVQIFWSRGVQFSGDLEFKFVPEAGHPDRAFSPEVNVVIYFKSHHSLLHLHCSHILVDPVYYLRTLFSLFQCIVYTISGYLFTLFHCIVCTIPVHCFLILLPIDIKCLYYVYLRSESVVKFASRK